MDDILLSLFPSLLCVCSSVMGKGGNCIAEIPKPTEIYLEQKVLLFFRLWHMIFLCSGGVLAVIIFLCCCFKCRIPRTKQEIESDYRRKKVTRKFRRELNKMQMEEIDIKDIRSVLDKVRDKFSRKYSLNKDGQEEENANLGGIAALKQRLINMFSMKKQPKKDPNEEDNNGEEKEEEKDNEVVETIAV